MMKKPYLNHAIVAAALLGLAGFSGTTLSADDAAKKPEAAAEQGKPDDKMKAEQAKPDEKAQAKPDDKTQAKPDEKAQAKKDGVKLQDYSKAGAYKDGKQVEGSTGQVAGDKPGAEKGAAGPAAPAAAEKSPEGAKPPEKADDKGAAEPKK